MDKLQALTESFVIEKFELEQRVKELKLVVVSHKLIKISIAELKVAILLARHLHLVGSLVSSSSY